MKIKPPQPHIPENNPFAEDALGREQSAKALTQLISTIDEPFVLAIDSTWGTGKTTFLKMWLQALRNDGYPCLYFNAWENDFSDDPLVSLIGELELGFDSIVLDSKKKIKAREHFLKAKKLGAVLVKRSIPAAIKIVTAGVIDADKVSEEILMNLSEKLANDMIEKYEKDKSTILGFKERLRDFVKELARPEGYEDTKPLILFIDELDRCRPTYALELLEKAKHFFNIEGIVFVLAIDKQQIGHSIKSVYGIGMDVNGYLRRFIDLDYHLPEPKSGTFCNALFNKFGFDDYFKSRAQRGYDHDSEQLLDVLSKLFTIFGFSLRVQEQCFSRLSIVFRTTPPNSPLHPVFLSALIVLKVANPELYADYVRKTANAEEVLRYIREASVDKAFPDGKYDMNLEAYFVYGQCSWQNINSVIAEYQRKTEDENLSETQRNIAGEIIGIMKSFRPDWGILSNLANKIEMAENFLS